jgi:hypothetical protein
MVTVTRDRPAPWWFLAILFTVVSACFIYLTVAQGSEVRPWQAILTGAMSLAGILAGVYVASEAPLSVVSLDPAANELVITRLGLTGRKVARVRLHDLAYLTTLQRQDDEGYEMTRPAVVLKSGETVLLSMLWRHGSTDTNLAIERMATHLPALARRAAPKPAP